MGEVVDLETVRTNRLMADMMDNINRSARDTALANFLYQLLLPCLVFLWWRGSAFCSMPRPSSRPLSDLLSSWTDCRVTMV